MKATQRMYNTRELAKLLHVSYFTLCRWRKSQRGPGYIQMGLQFFYPQAAVQKWLDKQPKYNVEIVNG